MPVIERALPLFEKIGRFRFDPLGYVTFAFPWGRPGTALADDSGPEPMLGGLHDQCCRT